MFAILLAPITKSDQQDLNKQGNPKHELKHGDTNALHSYFSLLLPQYLKIKWAERKTLCFVTALLTMERQWHRQHTSGGHQCNGKSSTGSEE